MDNGVVLKACDTTRRERSWSRRACPHMWASPAEKSPTATAQLESVRSRATLCGSRCDSSNAHCCPVANTLYICDLVATEMYPLLTMSGRLHSTFAGVLQVLAPHYRTFHECTISSCSSLHLSCPDDPSASVCRTRIRSAFMPSQRHNSGSDGILTISKDRRHLHAN